MFAGGDIVLCPYVNVRTNDRLQLWILDIQISNDRVFVVLILYSVVNDGLGRKHHSAIHLYLLKIENKYTESDHVDDREVSFLLKI